MQNRFFKSHSEPTTEREISQISDDGIRSEIRMQDGQRPTLPFSRPTTPSVQAWPEDKQEAPKQRFCVIL